MKKLLFLFFILFPFIGNSQLIDFKWEETGETQNGYAPGINVSLGESYQLNFSTSPYTPDVFSDLNNWVFYELIDGQFVVVDSPSIFSITKEGKITGLEIGIGAIRPTGFLQGDRDRLYVQVNENSESNDEPEIAQVVTSEPTPLQENSNDVIIYFHADRGSKSLMGLNASTKLYAHTGVDLSNGATWQSAPGWGNNADKYELNYVSENLWSLYIGDMRTYYNITDPDVMITRLCFVFRTADTTRQTEDLFVDVVEQGLQVIIQSSDESDFITPESAYRSFTVTATEEADLSLSINGNIIKSALNTKTLTGTYLFDQPGDYSVVATASANGETVSTSINYFFATDSQPEDYPGYVPVMGPVRNEDGSVTFCLGAPLKNSVVIVGSWNDYKYTNEQVMSYQDIDDLRYFWVTVPDLDYDTMYGYYFLVDGEKTVSDPYARLVVDPNNDKYLDTNAFSELNELPAYPDNKISQTPLAIYQGSINDYDWEVTDFEGVEPSQLVIYELLFRDFTGTEGKADGNGTVKLALEKLPYLIDLGVNAIELLPINEFNGNNSWGYNPNFYFAPDKAYGTPDDYKQFIDECHKNGIAVILDMVFNQTDWLHPWYQMYDVGSNPFYNATAPHAYSVLNDINQGMPMIQEQWADVLRYWLKEYKVDGFRFDLVKGLGNNDSYANNGDAATNAFNQSRIDRMIALHAIMKEVNPKAYFINENLAGPQEENDMAKDGQLNWANINDAGCQFAMGYPSGSNLNRMYAPNDSRTWGSTVSYLESHDEQRLAYKQDQWGVAGVKGNAKESMRRIGGAAAQMLMAPGAHMIWQFSEMGNAQNTKDNNGGNNTSPKIVNWELLDEPNHAGLVDCYRQLIYVRNQNPEMFTQDVTFKMNCNANNWDNGRTISAVNGDSEIITVINPNVSGNLTVSYDFLYKDNSVYQLLSKSYESYPSFDAENGTVTVPANCYVVIGSSNLHSEVKTIEAEESAILRAYADTNAIVVDYAPEGVEIYSLAGSKIASVKERARINVASGVYILRSGTTSLKLLVP